jgi:hypothetical protein
MERAGADAVDMPGGQHLGSLSAANRASICRAAKTTRHDETHVEKHHHHYA